VYKRQLRDRDPLGGLTPTQIVSSAVLVAMFKRPVCASLRD